MKGYVLSCFDYTGNMVKPWADAGFHCYCVDSQHPDPPVHPLEHPFITKVSADMKYWVPPMGKCHIAFFAPPCTDVAISGARFFQSKGIRAIEEAIRLFRVSVEMAEKLECPWVIENPVSMISTYWRKPDYFFDPWEYGDFYTKKTSLWVGNDFIMPDRQYAAIDGSYKNGVIKLDDWDNPDKAEVFQVDPRYIPNQSPGPERQNIRSATPMGFANAVFEANKRET